MYEQRREREFKTCWKQKSISDIMTVSFLLLSLSFFPLTLRASL